jgi:hypothetical protein
VSGGVGWEEPGQDILTGHREECSGRRSILFAGPVLRSPGIGELSGVMCHTEDAVTLCPLEEVLRKSLNLCSLRAWPGGVPGFSADVTKCQVALHQGPDESQLSPGKQPGL